jgi:uncharacterized lipoprotein YmbA
MKFLLPILVLAIGLVGCGSSATSTNAAPALDTTPPAVGQKKCDACSTNVAVADTVEKDGKTYCKTCADLH